nr:ectoine synthase [Burkholderia sp. MS455]
MVPAGTESLLQYRNHLEACYCIAGHAKWRTWTGTFTRSGREICMHSTIRRCVAPNGTRSTAHPDRHIERLVKRAYSGRVPINLAGAYA